MGTNYYVTEEEPCDKCGRGGEMRHIGKSSAGWCFSLRVYPEDGIDSLDGWKKFWVGKHIEDEYGNAVSEGEMLACITERERPDFDWDIAPPMHTSWEQFHAENGSERGPKGMVRYRIDRRCIGRGEGTWDYFVEEFS